MNVPGRANIGTGRSDPLCYAVLFGFLLLLLLLLNIDRTNPLSP